MRRLDRLVHGRTRVRRRYALMPLEGFPTSRLPSFPDAAVRVLASPRLGAEFVQYLIELPAGKRGEFVSERGVETFYYVMSGAGVVRVGGGAGGGGSVFTFNTGSSSANSAPVTVRPGSFGLVPPGTAVAFEAKEGGGGLALLVLRKRYEAAAGVRVYEPLLGHESAVEAKAWAENPDARLQTLVPDEMAYDLAMNIFTFSPGHGLPVIETHVMEHGAYILEGKGVYYLEEEWMEVEKDDFIWMGPYCPQSFYATGPTGAKYLYYKNVNREIAL